MKIELHLHTNRYSGCAVNTPEEMMAALIDLGYQAVFITEHDAIWPKEDLRELQRKFPAIRIFPGLELTLPNPKKFEHLLILGADDPAFLVPAPAAEVIARAQERQFVTILAHPFRWDGAGEMLSQGHRPDAVELLTPNHTPLQAEMARTEAERLGLAGVNAGDAHAVSFLGKYWIETQKPIDSPARLRDALSQGRYENRQAEEIPWQHPDWDHPD
jgi:predicted metal-dependent phosphoesterase TrpH